MRHQTTARASVLRRGLIPALATLVVAAAAMASPTVAPVNIDLPTITGTARQGEVLTAQNGTWENSPTEFRYRWLRCNPLGNSCVLLAADGKTYRVGQVDVGHTMRVRVTAINADGSTNARSEQTEVVVSNAAPLTNTARPTISGEARVGQELSASEGTWTGNPDVVRLPVAALRCRHAHLRERDRRNRKVVRCAACRPRLPSASRSDRPDRQPLGYGDVECDRHRRSDDADHEPATDAPHHLGPVHGRTCVRAVPDLRRHRAEPRGSRDRDEAGRAIREQALRNARSSEAMRRLHAQLAPGSALPRPRPLHDHTSCS